MVDHCINPSNIVLQARSWIGTPYKHQQSTKHVGCDCLGLLRGVWKDLYGIDAEMPPPYTSNWAEVQTLTQHNEPMLDAAKRNLQEIPRNQLDIGDVVLIRVRRRSLIKHCAIISAVARDPRNRMMPARIIHAYSGHTVTDDPIHRNWINCEMHFFRFRPLAEVV